MELDYRSGDERPDGRGRRLGVPRARDLLAYVFRKVIRKWSLRVTWADGSVSEFGDGTAPRPAIRLTAAAERAILAYPALKLGECFMDGGLVVEEGSIYDVLQIFIGNRALMGAPKAMKALSAAGRITRIGRFNDSLRAQRNVAHHYDLDGRLYDLFLDDRHRQYSCAYFADDSMTLDEAQEAKLDRIALKLRPGPGMRALDIGSGWGGLACRLGQTAGLNVLGVTLSREQLAAARERADGDGVADRVRFELRDYREISDPFDRIVSVGMLEHVGRPQLKAYFAKVRQLLAEDGIALIHSIGSYGKPWPTNPWLAKYIFPGGYIPSLSEAVRAAEANGLLIADVEIWRLHYAETLKAWRERFLANREKAAELYDDRFCRMWEFYLAGSECSFRFGSHMVFQLLLVRDRNVLPPTRKWMDG